MIQIDAGYVIRANVGGSPFHCNINRYCQVNKKPYPKAPLGRNKSSEEWWTVTVKDEVLSRFESCLSEEEQCTGSEASWRIFSGSLRPRIDIPLLVKRFEALAGVKLRSRVHHALTAVPKRDFVLIRYDVEELLSRVVHMGLIEFAEAAALVLEVKARNISDSPERDIELLRIALAKVSTAANNAAPVNAAMHFYWGMYLLFLDYHLLLIPISSA